MIDALDLVVQRVRRTHQLILNVAGDLTDDQLAWRPQPRAHSMGWTLWHLARCADRFAAEAADASAPRREIWLADDLARRWRLDAAIAGVNGAGTGVDDDVAARLRPPSGSDLLDYARRSFVAVEALVERLDPPALAREHESIFADGRASVGQALVACLAHDNRHLGELEYIKGLQGLRGTATR